jgi:hypothetical protein
MRIILLQLLLLFVVPTIAEKQNVFVRANGGKGQRQSKGKGKGSKMAKQAKSSKSNARSPKATGAKTNRPTGPPGPPNTFFPTPSQTTPAPIEPTSPPPVIAPTESPSVPARICVSNEAELNAQLQDAVSGAVIELCGGGTILSTTAAAIITSDQTTLGCLTPPGDCTMQSNGNDSNLVVNGNNVTIRDITFLDGSSGSFSGGNVGIFGNGNHRILNCSFQNGQTNTLGGNLYVQTDGNVEIRDSSFVAGTSTQGSGGGLAVQNADLVSIFNSQFIGNNAPEGGGFYSSRGALNAQGQQILIRDSVFQTNLARVGGGFLVTALGLLPKLEILNTEFVDNTAENIAGAGAIVDFLDNLNLTLNNNSGSGNTDGSNTCGDITAVASRNSSVPLCIGVNETYP